MGDDLDGLSPDILIKIVTCLIIVLIGVVIIAYGIAHR